MRYRYHNVKALQLEITTHCNAACPQCPRNHHGGCTIDELPMISWNLHDLQTVIEPEFVKQLDFVYFCGTYGDPMFNKSVVEMCEWLKICNPNLRIGIHTNGSLGARKAYRQLATLIDFMSFGIDGMEDTNPIYRRHTVWSVIMQNIRAYIESGGSAHWDFIVFEHNQHQVELARALSEQLGFRTFNIKKTYRFFNKAHQLTPVLDVLDNQGKKIYEIRPPSQSQYQNKSVKLVPHIQHADLAAGSEISCAHLTKNEIYIGADGYVFPCGWLHDRLYGIESAYTPDRDKLWRMMESAGGRNRANCFHTPLRSIIDGEWFHAIQASWTSSQRTDRCAWLCGGQFRGIKEQNELLQYEI